MAVALLWTCAWLQPTPTAIIQLISIFGSRPCSLEGLALSLYLYPCLFPSVLPGIDQQTSHLSILKCFSLGQDEACLLHGFLRCTLLCASQKVPRKKRFSCATNRAPIHCRCMSDQWTGSRSKAPQFLRSSERATPKGM